MSPSSSVLDDFLQQAGAQGERAAAWARLLLCTLAISNIIFLSNGLPRMLAGSVKFSMMTSVLLIGCVFSLWYIRKARTPPRWSLDMSVLIDAALVITVIGASVMWPTPLWQGILSIPHISAFSLAIVASGLRLSYRTVAISAVANFTGMIIWLLVDSYQNHIYQETDDIGAFFAMQITSVVLGAVIVRRVRVLVGQGASAALKAERARLALGVYVSQEVADAALASEELRPGGERRRVTVLFSDIYGFTSYSEKLPPERLVRELNAYLAAMLEVIRKEGGVVDKYMGDAIMVVFGIPRSDPEDARKAIRAAIQMQAALALHNEERKKLGLPAFMQGIGVHTGEVVAGNVGTEDRLQYTVIGDAVNTASRLENATRSLRVPTLISRDTALAAGMVEELKSCGKLVVRGREEELEVFTATG
jgi:class 3 adenylate cyclase